MGQIDAPNMSKPGALKFALRALRSRNYRLFFTGQLVSLVGTFLTQVATSWLVYRLARESAHPERAPVLLGIVSFASLIPLFVLAPFAGVWVDRWDRRKMMIVTQALAMVQSFTLAIVARNWLHVPVIVVLALIQGLINAFDIPARQALILDLVEGKEDLANAVALNSAMLHSARLIGPSLAGLLIPYIGEWGCFTIDGVSYMGVIAALIAIRTRPRATDRTHKHPLREMHEGFAYVWNFTPIRTLLIFVAILSITASPALNVLMPIFADALAHRLPGPTSMGLLIGFSGLGAVIGTIYLALRPSIVGLGRVIAVASALYGVTIFLFALSNTLWLSLLIIPVIGFAMITTLVPASTVIQILADEDKRGRVMSFYTMAFGMMPFGSLIAGAAAHALGGGIVGAQRTLMLAAIVCIAASIWFTLMLPGLRRIVRPIYVAMGHLPASSLPTSLEEPGVPVLQENGRAGKPLTSGANLLTGNGVSLFDSLDSRRRQHELMDAPDVDPGGLRQSLQFIRRINRFLGYNAATIKLLEQFSSRWKPGERITILDVATGSADVPLAILRWADSRGHDVRIVGVDIHAQTARIAAQEARDPRLKIVRGDALRLPFLDGAFDYCLTSLFLHHLDDPDVVRVLREMDRLSRRGIIAADLMRDRRALAWIKLFTSLSNPIVRHDASVSVAQAFSKEEVLALRDAAHLQYAAFHSHIAHRFTLAGEKRLDSPAVNS